MELVCAKLEIMEAKMMLSKFRTVTLCGPDLETLTMSDGECQNTKVVDLFEIFTIESDFALFGFQKRKL